VRHLIWKQGIRSRSTDGPLCWTMSCTETEAAQTEIGGSMKKSQYEICGLQVTVDERTLNWLVR
jgi:hypothetical protein